MSGEQLHELEDSISKIYTLWNSNSLTIKETQRVI